MKPESRVFISYSSKDRGTAETLHQALAAAGIGVWRDQPKLESNWSREIAEALAASDTVCVIWTAQAAQSPWVQHEWLTGRALGLTLIPCIFPDAPALPRPLENIHGIVVVDVATLAAQFLDRLSKFDDKRSAYDYRLRPDRFDVPFQPIPSFVGRAADLLDLYLNLLGDLNNTGTRAVGLVGMGGTGKTQLAVELAWRFGFAFTGTYWLDATDSSRWRTQLADLARRLKLPVADSASAVEQQIEQQWLAAFKDYCREHPRTLLILDNVANPAALAENLPGTDVVPLALGCNLLFTTRHRFEFESNVVLQDVGMLSTQSAYALLTAARKPATAPEVESAEAIANALGYLPLALVLAAAYIRRLGSTFKRYRELLAQYGLDAIDTSQASKQKLATRHEAAVGSTLAEQWRMIDNEQARLLFKLAGQFPEGSLIPKRRLEILSGIGPGKTEIERPFDEAVLDLRDLSLIELPENKRAIALHPLVRDFSWRLVVEGERLAFRAEAGARLAQAYADGPRLEHEYEDRGADDVLGDLEVAGSWQTKDDRSSARLDYLRQLFLREGRNLEREELQGVPKPLLFQQLHHRALLMGKADPDLLQNLRESQSRHGVPIFVTRTVTTSEDPAQIRVLQNDSPITGLCLLNDGSQVLSASRDGTLALWDVNTGRFLKGYRGHGGAVAAVQVTADGTRALSGSADRTLILWDVKTAEQLRTLHGHTADVRAVGMTPDGRRALSMDDAGRLAWWDLERGECLGDFKTPGISISALSLSPDGRQAISGWDPYQGFLRKADDLTVVLLDLESGQIARSLPGHSGLIMAIDVDWQRQLALIGSAGGTTVLSDLTTGEGLKQFRRASKVVNAVSLVPGGQFVLTGTEDGLVLLWETKDRSDAEDWTPESDVPIREFHGHGAAVSAICVTPDGARAVTGSADGTLIVWNLREEGKAPAQHHVGNVMSVCLNGDGTRALSGAQDSSLILWDAATGSRIHTLQEHRGEIARVSMSADGTRAASNAFNERHTLVWDLESGKVTRRLGIPLTHSVGRRNELPPILSSTMSADGRLVLTTTARNDLVLWNLETGRPRIYGSRDPVMMIALAISADQSRFALGWDKTSVVVWAMNGGSVAELTGHSDLVFCGALSGDGRIAATGARDRMVIVWDVDNGQPLHRLAGHSEPVMGVALSPDGRRVLSASFDKTLILWDVETGRPLNRMVFESPVLSVAWRGERVVLGQGGGAVSFLELR